MEAQIKTNVVLRNHLGQFRRDIEQAAYDTIADAVKEGAGYAKAFAPMRTGRLRESIEPVVVSRTQGAVVADTPYALAQEEGARPHVIEGNPKLSFYASEEGSIISVNSVNHPGNRGVHYLKRAHEIIMRRIMSIAQRHYPG